MVALRAGEDGRAEACWREAACGTVSFHDGEGERLKTLYLARMPESRQAHAESLQLCKRGPCRISGGQRPDIAHRTAVADGAPDNWTFLESLWPKKNVCFSVSYDSSGEELNGGDEEPGLRCSDHCLEVFRQSPVSV